MIGRVGARISDVSMHRGPGGLDHLRDLHTRCRCGPVRESLQLVFLLGLGYHIDLVCCDVFQVNYKLTRTWLPWACFCSDHTIDLLPAVRLDL